MRAIIVAISVMSVATTSAAAAPSSGATAGQTRCVDDPAKHFAQPGKGAQMQKLTDLPPAEGYFAVFRRGADGCVVPVRLNYRHGKAVQQPPVKPPRP